MYKICLLTILFAFQAQAGLWCALGDKTPEQHAQQGQLMYQSVMVDAMNEDVVQVHIEDHYDGRNSEVFKSQVLESTGTINGILLGYYDVGLIIFQNGDESIKMHYKNILYTCQIP